ncbi:MAG: aspartate ammonia-lyase [Candidatus Micrarchaeota archaeon]
MRTEEDFLGKAEVPDDAYYGIFTVRASNTFKLSGQKVDLRIIRAVVMIKRAASLANMEVGSLDKQKGDAIVKACDEVLAGKFDKEFILDAFQAGAGTPLHMNVNEVIANRATEIIGGKKGQYLVHPNNHVNMGQSSNDVTPTAIKIAAILEIKDLDKEIVLLEKLLDAKAKKYAELVKCGRTHLQDAVPVTYGQVFDAYRVSIMHDRDIIEKSPDFLGCLGIGGNAIGTGITAHPDFRKKLIAKLNEIAKIEVYASESPIKENQNMNSMLYASSCLRNYAVSLNKIANDLRLLCSGPKTGIGEMILPAVEPGSSIMPGKINPSVPEAVNMCCFQVMGNDHVISLATQSGQLELNWMTPLIGYNLMQSLELLKNATKLFREECIDGLVVDEKRTKELFDSSFAYATALNPYLGYSLVSKLVTEAYQKGKTLKELILEKKIMDKKDLEKVISITGPAEVDKEILKRVKK